VRVSVEGDVLSNLKNLLLYLSANIFCNVAQSFQNINLCVVDTSSVNVLFDKGNQPLSPTLSLSSGCGACSGAKRSLIIVGHISIGTSITAIALTT